MAGSAFNRSSGVSPGQAESRARELTEVLLRDSQLQRLFNQYLTSSWRDLHKFVEAYLNWCQDGNDSALQAAAANVMDIAAVAEPVTIAEFPSSCAALQAMYAELQALTGTSGPAELLSQQYDMALAERAACLRRYFQIRPHIAALLLEAGQSESHPDLSTFARHLHEQCCNAMLELLEARRALVYYRKDKAFDLSNATFEPDGQLCAIVAMVLRNPAEVSDAQQEADAKWREREQLFLLSDTTRPTRGLHAVPELAALLNHPTPLLMLADAGHFAMIREHASQHFPPMLLALEYVMSVVYHRKYIQEADLPSAAELQELPLDEYYADPYWQFFQGGFSDYMARVTIPICAEGGVFAFIAVDSFQRPLGSVTLDERSRQTLLEYELYRRQRKTLQVQHLPAWLREHEPQLVRDFLAAVPDAIKDEDEFLRHRGMDFMDAECARRFFAFLQQNFAIRFDATTEDIEYLSSRFKSATPMSRQLTRFAALLGEDVAAAFAALDALAATETKSHRAALIHVNKERNLTSRTLRHEGINKLTALRNSILDLNDYLLALDQAWKHYILDFGKFSEQYIDDSLYERLGQAVKPLYNLLEERDKALEAIQHCNGIGGDLNDLLLRYKGAEFRKSNELIHALIDEVLEMYSELYFVGSRIEVIRDYCDPALKVFCYRDLLLTVFCAYLDNAYEALLKIEDKRTIQITTSLQRDFFHFSISDSGCGFAGQPAIAADPMQLYGSFTSKDGEGHGVGLTIVKEIIEDVEFHNGRLDTPESTAGRTTFGFAIPLEETRSIRLSG